MLAMKETKDSVDRIRNSAQHLRVRLAGSLQPEHPRTALVNS